MYLYNQVLDLLIKIKITSKKANISISYIRITKKGLYTSPSFYKMEG